MIKYLNTFLFLMIKRKHTTIIIKTTTKKKYDNNNNKKFNLTQKNHDIFPNHISKPFYL